MGRVFNGKGLRATAAVGLAIAVGAAPLRGATLYVVSDNGGSIQEYAVRVASEALLYDTIRISGRCASACTMYLSAAATCVERGALFGFHAASGSTEEQNARATQMMVQLYPVPLQSWFAKNAAHLSGADHAPLTGAELIDMGAARECEVMK